MIEVEAGRFTVGVFQNVAWAQKGIEALIKAGIPTDAMTILAKESAETTALVERYLGTGAECLEVAALGPTVAKGPLVAAIQGPGRDLGKLGLAGTLRRVGFQPHDGRIFETLTARGGVLVSIHSEPLAADALAVLLSYGGGNAAIGAWTGRV
jgi:hypothetical protein